MLELSSAGQPADVTGFATSISETNLDQSAAVQTKFTANVDIPATPHREIFYLLI
ncbi:MAG: hypothetical protein U0457_05380 [Candidatus Sericytochromatia bacterium]